MKSFTKAAWAVDDTYHEATNAVLLTAIANTTVETWFKNSPNKDDVLLYEHSVIYPYSTVKLKAGLTPGDMLLLW